MFTRAMRTAWVVMGLLVLIVLAFSAQTILVPAARSEVAVPMYDRAPLTTLLHILGAMVALAVGVLQIDPAVRRRSLALHRWLGRAYVIGVLVSGTSGLLLAPFSFGGMVTHLGFGGLGLLWLVTTYLALAAILRGDVTAHREWMIRSYALTLAGVMLRIYLPVSMVAGAEFEAAYRIISWACWVPNLVVAELFFIGRRRAARAHLHTTTT